jgi:transposase
LVKMAGPRNIVWSRPLPEGTEPSTVTVSRDAAGRWFVSILIETRTEHHEPIDRTVGANAGVESLVTLSTEEKVANPRQERRDRARMATAHRAISDASWSELRSMLEYKAHWYGHRAIAVDQWFPASKTWSVRGKLGE